MSNILNPEFKYTDAAHTDIRVLFERIRKEREEQQDVLDEAIEFHTEPA